MTAPPSKRTVKATHALLERAVVTAGKLGVKTGCITSAEEVSLFVESTIADIERAVRGDDVSESTARMVACAMETAGAKGVRLVG